MNINNKKMDILGIVDSPEDFRLNKVFFVPGGHLFTMYYKNQKKIVKKIPLVEEKQLLMLTDIIYSEKLKVKDFILFANKNITFLKPLIGYDCDLFCKEGLKKAYKYKDYDDEKIEYVSLSKRLELSYDSYVKAKVVEGSEKWVLSGLGHETMQGALDNSSKERYSLDLTPLPKLMNLQFKIDTSIKFFHTKTLMGVENNLETISNAEEYVGSSPSLLTVLHALFKNIGAMGDPLEKQKIIDSLKETMEERMKNI